MERKSICKEYNIALFCYKRVHTWVSGKICMAGIFVDCKLSGIIIGHYFYTADKLCIMEKRVLGIVLTLLGIAGLVLGAVNFMNGGSGNKNIKEILIFTILGVIFFFTGISLVRSTNDKAS